MTKDDGPFNLPEPHSSSSFYTTPSVESTSDLARFAFVSVVSNLGENTSSTEDVSTACNERSWRQCIFKQSKIFMSPLTVSCLDRPPFLARRSERFMATHLLRQPTSPLHVPLHSTISPGRSLPFSPCRNILRSDHVPHRNGPLIQTRSPV